jgi:hypothetical protein
MASYTTGQAGGQVQPLTNIPAEYTADALELARAQRMAQMLSSAPMAEGQMISGRYVAPSWTQSLAQLANAATGAYFGNQAEEKQLKLAEKLRQDKLMTQQGIMDAIDKGDTKKALAIASSRPEYSREFIAPLMANVIPKAPTPTTDMQNYEFAKSQGFKGTITDFKNQITPYQQARLDFDRQKFEFDKATKVGGKDLTEAQGKASAFQSQMVSASNAVNTLEAGGFDPTLFKSQTAVRLAGGTANPLVPVTAQQYKQAQDQWSEAYLRFKTGAAATEQEVIRNNRTYFPVFGDKPDQIAQKAMMREQAERDVGIAAGRGAGIGAQPIGQQPKTEKPKDENVDIQSQLRTKGIPYQPKLYEYRINSDGSVDRKKKTQ